MDANVNSESSGRRSTIELLPNLVPLAGALFASWDVPPLIHFFWLETLVIGSFAFARMLTAQRVTEGIPPSLWLVENLFIGAFFILVFGGAMTLFGIFLPDMCGGKGTLFATCGSAGPIRQAGRIVAHYRMHWAFLAMALAHGVYFWRYYVRPGAYRKTRASDYFQAPFDRLAILCAVVFTGNIVTMHVKASLTVIVAVIVFKSAMELVAYQREHRRDARRQIAAILSDPGRLTTPLRQAASVPCQAPDAGAAEVLPGRDPNHKPLGYYLGSWRLAAGQQQIPGWFTGGTFHEKGGRVRLQFSDETGGEMPDDALQDVRLQGNSERVEYVELRMLGSNKLRILRFTVSVAEENGLDLLEIHQPKGNPDAMQARSFALRRTV